MAAKGGHNAESHNHNDIGNAVVYIYGRPVLIDAGVETYSRKTFSAERYTLWTMQSAYHTLPTVNGVQQSPGRTFAARDVHYASDDTQAQFTLDIAGAYPEAAGINTWVRTVALNRGKDIVISDAYDLKSITGDLALNLVTPCEVDAGTPGILRLKEAPLTDGRTSGVAQVHYDAGTLNAVSETISIEDANLRRTWGDRLTRVILRAMKPSQKGAWTLRITR